MLLDAAEIPEAGELRFTWACVPYTYRRGPATRLRVQRGAGWEDCPESRFSPAGVRAVEFETCC